MPPFLQSVIVEALSQFPDVHVLTGDSYGRLSGDQKIDVVLTGAADPDDFTNASDLLARWPRSRILLVSSSGRHAAMYQLYPRKLTLGDLSTRALANAIRSGFDVNVN